MKRFCVVLMLTLTGPLVGCLAAQELNFDKSIFTPAEKELIEIIDALDQRYEAQHAEAEKIGDPVQKDRFYSENDPAREAVPRLLEFEARHRGREVGLMALRRLVFLGAGSGDPDSAATQGRREAYKRLHNYADNPLLVDIIRTVHAGATEPTTEGLLRSLSQNPNANEIVREFSRLFLAEWMISQLDSRKYVQRRVQALQSGEAMQYPLEEEFLSRKLETYATMP